jgi:co-chaperonin GroES (HSP10)
MSGVRLERFSPDSLPETVTIRPLRDYIIVKPIEWRPSATIDVIHKNKPLRGTITAVGPGCYPKRYNKDRTKTWDSQAFRRTEVKVGDTVELGGLEIGGYLFPEIMIGNTVHVIAREEDVCAVHNKAKASA